jgi:transposase
MNEPEVLVGSAVATVPRDVALRPTADRWPVRHEEPGRTLLVERWRTIPPALLVREATGGLEVPVAGAWAEAGLPVVVVPPRQARDCATATGRLATTAPREAQGLAHVAAAVRPSPRALPAAQAHALRARLTRRRQVGPRRTAARRRRHRAPQRIGADLPAHSTGLERRLARTDDDLAAAIRSSPLWRATDEMWQRRPGVGPVLARPVVAEGPEVGLLHRQTSAARSGVAPFTGDRGTRRGQRVVWGGRAHGRAVLSMRPVSAGRHHPVLKAFDARLRAAGNAAKVALTASMRKRLTRWNALINHHTCWQANTA